MRSPADTSTIVEALGVAADAFNAIAAQFRRLGCSPTTEAMARTYDNKAREALELREKLKS